MTIESSSGCIGTATSRRIALPISEVPAFAAAILSPLVTSAYASSVPLGDTSEGRFVTESISGSTLVRIATIVATADVLLIGRSTETSSTEDTPIDVGIATGTNVR